MKSINIDSISHIFCIRLFLFRYKRQVISCFLIMGYLWITLHFLIDYLITDYIVWATLVLSFYIIKPDKTRRGNKRYLFLSVIIIILAYISGIKTLYFLSLGSALLFAIETFLGTIGYLPVFLLGLLSPTFKFFNNLLGFPVRLKLSEWAGNILMHLGYQIEVNGNILVLNGAEFSVDPACVGLKMMSVSILGGLLIMAFFRHQHARSFKVPKITLILLLIIGFNIAGNLIRIMLLTIFRLPPENPCHEVVGILCFLIYIMIPSYFMIKWFANRLSERPNNSIQPGIGIKPGVVINGILLTCILITGMIRFGHPKVIFANAPEISMTGYSKVVVNGDVVKLEKPGILIYIKPIQSFYCAEHSPMICWVGSGYKFDRINRQVICNKEVYTGILSKGKDHLFTAWWYDNGSYRTGNQFDCRWRTLKGENFNLVNVSAEDESVLQEEICKLYYY